VVRPSGRAKRLLLIYDFDALPVWLRIDSVGVK